MESAKESELKIDNVYESYRKVVEDLTPFESGLVVVGKTEKGNKLKGNSYALYSAKKTTKFPHGRNAEMGLRYGMH